MGGEKMSNSLRYDMAPPEEKVEPCLCGDMPEMHHTRTIMESYLASEEVFRREGEEWILRCVGCGISTVISSTRDEAVSDWNTFIHRWGVKE
jgi:hypothetical protein